MTNKLTETLLSSASDSDESDESLMGRIRAQDTEALASLFRKYARLIRTVAIRIVKDVSEADDLVQDIFLFIFHKSTLFDESKCSARSWIVQVAYSRSIDRRRRLTSRHFYNRLDFDSDATNVCDTWMGASHHENSLKDIFGRDELRNMFEALSDKEKETLRMHFFEGYDFAEIASITGQSVTSIRHRYYRGLNKLRKSIFDNRQRSMLTRDSGKVRGGQ